MSDECCKNRSGAGTYDRDDIDETRVIFQGERVPVFGGTIPAEAINFPKECACRPDRGPTLKDEPELKYVGNVVESPFGGHVVEVTFNKVDQELVDLFTGGTVFTEDTGDYDPDGEWQAVPSKRGRLPVNDDGETVIDEANRVINGPRAQFYGPALVNHQRIADYWNTYINHVRAAGQQELQPHDVAWMMILLKIARVVESPSHRDSAVDTIGYAALAHSMAVETEES